MDYIKPLLQMNKRQLALQVLNICMIVSSALMIWKGLALVVNSESPIVVVLSGSMEPAFHRGDLLFLHMPNEPIRTGEICVFKLEGRDVPIVHRVLRVHDDASDGKQYILTKGDNNLVDDRGLYNEGQLWIHREDVIGRVKGFLPHVGIVTILMNDYPQVKYLLLGALALMVLVTKE
ncbi:hypothetical protein SeMB42_g05420 [Synchytrium endobioticum]|uniref:Signal peptidase complex catalytic subunit SEC11 n=1 Tax=Synchytrium endobioticum TaxID=286115 RepID=A0A507CRK6_9FUNG|nr:hypothetical protein SeLEV6574_g06408 [Synchytrium endobioticum]TPX41784.1 hypothetical protein SeMB42_g05420 [Synchytrium endobioticum]